MRLKTLPLIMIIMIITSSIPVFAQDQASSSKKVGGVTSLEDRVKRLEANIDKEPESDKWYDRIQVSGTVEIEANSEDVSYKDPASTDEKTSEIDLATVELGLDAKIVNHVEAHVLFKYEEDDLFVDEGFITLYGTDKYPVYFIAGRQYIPFGSYDSLFVTDPTTLVLGETNEGAAVAGFRFAEEKGDVSVGIFNGKAKEANDDDILDSVVASISFNVSENLVFGASYTSNLASSDSFSEVLVDADNMDNIVDGFSVNASFSFLDRFTLIGEYVGALDDFQAGDIYDSAETRKLRPDSFNLELGIGILENVDIAFRYGGSSDGGTEFLPETEYGAVLNWGVFENTNLAFEYINADYEDDFQETDVFTIQLAVEF